MADPTLGSSIDSSPDLGTRATTAWAGVPEGKVGRFHLLDKLGQGGMGVVFAAHDEQLDRKVALKFLTRSGSSRDRLEREARSLARLAHPNVIAVYEVGEAHGMPYLAMEYVPGPTLRAWIASEEPRSRLDVLRMFVQIGSGLAAAHEVGVVHRDFKPDNVIVGHDGRPRVLDFGLARVGTRIAAESSDPEPPDAKPDPADPAAIEQSGPGEPSLTATGAVMGTPAYMAPEQWAGAPADARTDQFAFCVALFEALYGMSPFAGTNTVELMEKVLDAEPLEIPAAGRVPAALHAAILRGLGKDPNRRWPDMRALLGQIEGALTRVQPGLFGGRPVIIVGLVVAIAFALLILPTAWLALELSGVIEYAPSNWLFISGGQMISMLLVLAALRRHIVAQISDPRILGGPLLVGLFVLGHRAITLATGSSIEVMFAYDFLATVGLASMMTYLVERALWPVIVMNSALTILATLRPEWGPRLWYVFTVCLPLTVVGSSLRSRDTLREGASSVRTTTKK